MPAWIEAGFNEYRKRMPREAGIELVEIKPEKRGSGKATEQILRAEAARILAAIPAHSELVVLDEHGTGYNTRQLAERLDGWRREGKDIALVIGGADGLHADVRQRAKLLWSLSGLTLPHGLVRVVVAEQLYRAATILQNHPYHRQ